MTECLADQLIPYHDNLRIDLVIHRTLVYHPICYEILYLYYSMCIVVLMYYFHTCLSCYL